MDNTFNPSTNRHFNYSGYGAVDDVFEGFDETVIKKKNSTAEVYDEILSSLGLEKNTMLQYINAILKTQNKNYKFVRITNDFQILYFEDESGHLTAITLQKIIDTKNHAQNTQYPHWNP